MSLTGGGLAQMSYQSNNHFESGLGMPGSGFASRRGGSKVFNKRLSMAPPSNISTINETQQTNTASTPRTSRSHLLAGLRTAPKSPMLPGSAPAHQVQHPQNLGLGRQTGRESSNLAAPHTAVGSNFGAQRAGGNTGRSMYGLPEILAPPELQYEQEQDTIGMDAEEYANLMAHGQQLAQQQMLLQQQLMSLTMAQQRMQNLNLGNGMGQQQQYMQSPMMNGFYNQQAQNGLQPVVEPVAGTPGLYCVFNPMTGQQSFMVNEAEQVQAPAQTPAQAPATNNELAHSPPPTTPTFHAQVSPPPESNAPVRTFRSPSPPKTNTPPIEVNPLPPPSATAFRRGHHKQLSSVTGFASRAVDGPKSSVPKTASFPPTPMTGTFGPGQSRAGDHPMRQPRGPPSLEELVSKPTSKHEGSKNFVTRQRRRAVNSLVRAGIDRRGASRGSNSIDSPGSGTPSSECEITFSVTSDTDNDSIRSSSSGSGSGSVHGAIGSERKKSRDTTRESNTITTPFTTASVSSEEGIDGKLAESRVDDVKADSEGRRGAPMSVLTSATEKRKSAIF